MAGNDDNRNPDGTFKPGISGNPAGQNGHTGLQPYGKRSAYLLTQYTTADIKRIVINADGKQQDGVSTYDLIILTHLAGTLAGDDKRLEREQLLDRMEGKPEQKTKSTVDMVMAGELKVIKPSDKDIIAEYLKAQRNAE